MYVVENYEEEFRMSRRLINMQDHYPRCSFMDRRAREIQDLLVEAKKKEFDKRREVNRLSTKAKATRLISHSYFTVESLFVLIVLTATLLILPLILPQLPPPPLMLLMLPIGILVLLMALAFAPPSVRDITCTKM